MIWNIDPAHSNVDFSVRHMAISTVRGRFEKLEGQATTDDTGRLVAVQSKIQASSINTNQPDRDNHLRSADFFDVEKNPSLDFVSTEITSTGANNYKVTGNLTMHGQTHPVTLNVEATDTIKDMYGNQRAAVSAKASLSRKEWGLTWNQVLELGGLVVSDEVKFTLDIEATQVQA